jgi:D-arabinose 1-dehydrogenase-like Zn-dependent alcohol dehydrogenase
MRAYQLPKGGAGIDALTMVDRPQPKPGHRQVLVKVAACSLNFRDLGIVRGTYRMPVPDNIVPLSDGAGEVVEVGSGVKRVKVGDKVAGCFFQRWPGGEATADVHTTALGGGIDGMLAEYVVLEEEGVVKVPAHLSLEEGATLPCAAVTVWHAMMEHAKLIAGQTVLLQALEAFRCSVCSWRTPWASRRSSPHRATTSSPRPRSLARATPSTTRPRPTGRKRQWSSLKAAASIMWSRWAGKAH